MTIVVLNETTASDWDSRSLAQAQNKETLRILDSQSSNRAEAVTRNGPGPPLAFNVY